MFNDACFAQVLEGPEAAVAATFERIQRDPRHTDVMVMQFERVEAYGFPDWSMAYVGARKGRDGYAAKIGFDFARLSGEVVFQELHDLVLDEERV